VASLLVCGVNLVLAFVIVRVTLYESPKGRVQQNRTILLVKKCKLDPRLLDEDRD
jgi:hypothetical protein